MSETKKLIERSVNKLHRWGNGIGVLISCEAKALALKPGDKVQVTAIDEKGRKYIVIEKFPPDD